MSAFKNKIKQLKITETNSKSKNNLHSRNACSATQLRFTCSPDHLSREQYCIKEPIYICKKNNKKETQPKKRQKKLINKVQPFYPVEIPQSPPSGTNRKFKYFTQHTAESTPCGNKEIEIHIEDEKNKNCLKKLFKKIHTLSEKLADSERQRIRLQLELNNLKNIDGFNRDQERNTFQLEGDNYKLKMQIEMLRNQLKNKEKQMQKIKNQAPNQIIKEIVVEKPVEVKVEVPKYIPGPQKIIEVSRDDNKLGERYEKEIEYYKQRIRKLENEVDDARQNRKSVREVERIPEIVEKPIYLQKPVYIEKPVFVEKQKIIEKPIDRQRIIEIPIQVPYEVPVYVQKPIVDEEFLSKINELEKDVETLLYEKQELLAINAKYRTLANFLRSNMQILRRHNTQKNRQVEDLLNNIDDYIPVKTKNQRDIIHTHTHKTNKYYENHNDHNAGSFGRQMTFKPYH